MVFDQVNNNITNFFGRWESDFTFSASNLVMMRNYWSKFLRYASSAVTWLSTNHGLFNINETTLKVIYHASKRKIKVTMI